MGKPELTPRLRGQRERLEQLAKSGHGARAIAKLFTGEWNEHVGKCTVHAVMQEYGLKAAKRQKQAPEPYPIQARRERDRVEQLLRERFYGEDAWQLVREYDSRYPQNCQDKRMLHTPFQTYLIGARERAGLSYETLAHIAGVKTPSLAKRYLDRIGKSSLVRNVPYQPKSRYPPGYLEDALALPMPLEDITAFLRIPFSTLKHYTTQERPTYRLSTHVWRGKRLTYRIAAQVYEQADSGATEEDICKALRIDKIMLHDAVRRRSEIQQMLDRVQQFVGNRKYDSEKMRQLRSA
jgi:hypothetical protein